MLAVPACSTPAEPVIRTVLAAPAVADAARVPCRAPVRVPERAVSSREVASLWGGDRAALRECETRRKAALGASHE